MKKGTLFATVIFIASVLGYYLFYKDLYKAPLSSDIIVAIVCQSLLISVAYKFGYDDGKKQ